MSERGSDSPLDPLPGLLAELDQMLKMVPQAARVARAYYDAYRGEGFSERQALYLVASQFRDPAAPSD